MEPTNEPESRKGEVFGVMAVFFPLAFAAVSLRLYSRIKFSRVGIDDVLIFLALVRLLDSLTPRLLRWMGE